MSIRPRPKGTSGWSALALLLLGAGTAGVVACIGAPQALAAGDGFHAGGSLAAGNSNGGGRDSAQSASNGYEGGQERAAAKPTNQGSDTPQASRSLSVSQSKDMSVQAADGAAAGQGSTNVQAEVLDRPGQTGVDAGFNSGGTLNRRADEDGHLTISSSGRAAAAIGGGSASGSSSSNLDLNGRSVEVNASVGR